ncbi:hypothetical protein ACOSQ3_022862 [Xanthoceras sorbifolium]
MSGPSSRGRDSYIYAPKGSLSESSSSESLVKRNIRVNMTQISSSLSKGEDRKLSSSGPRTVSDNGCQNGRGSSVSAFLDVYFREFVSIGEEMVASLRDWVESIRKNLNQLVPELGVLNGRCFLMPNLHRCHFISLVPYARLSTVKI